MIGFLARCFSAPPVVTGLVVLAALCGRPSRGLADVFLLANGGRVEGELLNPDQSPRSSYLVRTASGATVSLTTRQVQQVVRKSDAMRWYERWLPEMPQDARGNWIMSEECEKRGLPEQRKFHLAEVLKHDPEHEKARYALGYSRIDDRWIKIDEWMQSRGYVQYKGGWRLPQEVELEEADAKREQEEIEWRKNVKLWRSWILRGHGRENEGGEKIRSITNPAASDVLADLLEDPDESSRLKLLYVDVLSRLRTGRAASALITCAMTESDANVRDRCIDEVSEWGSRRATATLVQFLQHQNNGVVQRAGALLGRLNDPDAVLPLIDALNTKHRYVVNPGGGGSMTTSFSPQGGGGGMSMGGGPKQVEVEHSNAEVKAALAKLLPGVDHGYDEEAWRNWYAQQNTPPSVDLRRGR